jgi:hypothetical protein
MHHVAAPTGCPWHAPPLLTVDTTVAPGVRQYVSGIIKGNLMIEGIEGYYQAIATSMLGAIPEDWTAASFQAIFYPTGSVYEAEYVRKSDGRARSFQPGSGGGRAVGGERKTIQGTGNPLWGKARFDLSPDGSFTMTWGYDNCDTEGNTLFDADEELRRHEARRIRLTQNQ